jgi:mono/diheme cytochrome c family protein
MSVRPASLLTFTMAVLGAALLLHAEDPAGDSAAQAPSWTKAPPSAQAKANPYGGNADAVRAGRKLVARHCASCHGEDGHGGRSAPPLDSVAVRRAAAGDLFWLLTNGDLRAGMPSWSNLPDARRWQIVAFLQSSAPPPTAR